MSKGIPRKIWFWDNIKRKFWLAFFTKFLPVLLVASEIAESLTGRHEVLLLPNISVHCAINFYFYDKKKEILQNCKHKKLIL